MGPQLLFAPGPLPVLLEGAVPGPVGPEAEQVHLIGADLPLLREEGPPDTDGLLRLVHVELPVHPPELAGRVHVEQKQSPRLQGAADTAEGLPQVPLRRQIVQGVQGGDHRVHRPEQAEARHGLMEEQGRALQALRLCRRLGQHLLGGVRGDDLIAPLRQQARDGPRAAAQVQHRLHGDGAFFQPPDEKRRPAAVGPVGHQAVIAGGQGAVGAHEGLSFIRAKSWA